MDDERDTAWIADALMRAKFDSDPVDREVVPSVRVAAIACVDCTAKLLSRERFVNEPAWRDTAPSVSTLN